MIGLKIRRHQHKLRTFLQRLYDRFCCLNAVSFGRYGFGSYNSMAGLNVASYSGRNRAKIHRSGLIAQLLQHRPGQKGGIDIHMEYSPFSNHITCITSVLTTEQQGPPVIRWSLLYHQYGNCLNRGLLISWMYMLCEAGCVLSLCRASPRTHRRASVQQGSRVSSEGRFPCRSCRGPGI